MFKLIKIALNNISEYGFFTLIKIILFECFYFFSNNKKDLFVNQDHTDSYEYVRTHKNRYNAPHFPTPYYFLKIIEKKTEKINLKRFTLIDFGCGACRVMNFFLGKVKKTIGIDLNKNYKKNLISKKQVFLNFNLRNLKKVKNLSKKGNYILYFYEPFDLNLVKKIIKIFSKSKIIIILINYRYQVKKINILYKKNFRSKDKNIIVFSNFNI